MATAGKRIVLASGKFGVLSDGKFSTADSDGDCAECCGLDPCVACTGATPEVLEAVISDITECPCGSDGGTYRGGARSWKFAELPSVGPNGTFELTRLGDWSCTWRVQTPCTGEVSLYEAVDCTGAVLRTLDVVSFNASFQLGAFMRVWYGTEEGGFASQGVGGFAEIDGGDSPRDCTEDSVFNANELVCDDFWTTQNWHVLFVDGSVTVGMP